MLPQIYHKCYIWQPMLNLFEKNKKFSFNDPLGVAMTPMVFSLIRSTRMSGFLCCTNVFFYTNTCSSLSIHLLFCDFFFLKERNISWNLYSYATTAVMTENFTYLLNNKGNICNLFCRVFLKISCLVQFLICKRPSVYVWKVITKLKQK